MPRNKATTRLVSLLYIQIFHVANWSQVSVEEFLNFCLNDGNKEFIDITWCGDFWSNNRQKDIYLFNKNL